MELRDTYFADGTPTGKTITKDEDPVNGEYIICVGMWIVNDDNMIFVTKRSPEKKWAPNKWENTAGHVISGESSAEAVKRELFEETGICVKDEDIIFLGRAVVPGCIGDNFAVRANVDVSKVVFQPGETCGAKLVSLEELFEMAKTGELSPSVMPHMEGYKENFLKIFDK